MDEADEEVLHYVPDLGKTYIALCGTVYPEAIAWTRDAELVNCGECRRLMDVETGG